MKDSIQYPLKAAHPKPSNRDKFWDDLEKKDFGYIIKKYGKDCLSTKIKRKLMIMVKGICYSYDKEVR